eukprot:CAMPEP_0168423762 /NCGR_PEP_ID=MMETSP0228-20121227/34474_1 /TAXON_ID=133427 /ORGANISM="Protoceratium reticulatum, Strain CCCM 535 (=CCMP 1889)" /LENGTH=371 /DNA_ID=CAMNT_0008437731 /DNA_START=94 /DNA_END=1206 /DNA_ORIENTATION=+
MTFLRQLVVIGLFAGTFTVREHQEDLRDADLQADGRDTSKSAKAQLLMNATTQGFRVWVFVRAFKIIGTDLLNKVGFEGLAWHTEVLMCTTREMYFASLKDFVNSESQAWQDEFNKGSEEDQKTFWAQMQKLKLRDVAEENLLEKVKTGHRELTDEELGQVSDFIYQCTISGYPGVVTYKDQPIDVQGDNLKDVNEGKAAFYHPKEYQLQKLLFAGVVPDISPRFFLEKMESCGPWAWQSYRFTRHNCNTYTDAYLRGLGLPGLPTLLNEVASDKRGSWLPEKLVSNAKIPNPGYYDIQAKTCKGVICTGTLLFPDEAEEDIGKVALRREDPECSEGMCWEGGTFNPTTRDLKQRTDAGSNGDNGNDDERR